MRPVKDAIDNKTKEKVYLKGHAKATYMSDGRSVEDSMDDKADKVEAINHGTGDTTFALIPNIMHKWGVVSDLTLTLVPPSDGSVYNEYMFEFVSGSTATTLLLPDTLQWVSEPSIEAGYTYQCSIVDNIGVIVGVANS